MVRYVLIFVCFLDIMSEAMCTYVCVFIWYVCVFVCLHRLKEELIRELGKSGQSAKKQGELYRQKIQALEQVSRRPHMSSACDMPRTCMYMRVGGGDGEGGAGEGASFAPETRARFDARPRCPEDHSVSPFFNHDGF